MKITIFYLHWVGLGYNSQQMITDAYIIAGPTASGKSDFAHCLAMRIGGVVINCDSVQLYRDIENISASPFANRNLSDDIDGVPYRLFSVLPLSEQISVADYLDLARCEYDTAVQSGRTPIFVGGTGYYINALINGISPMPDVSDASRARARDMVASDIASARQLLPMDFSATDPQRISRALEVFFETGRHLSEFQNAPRIGAVVKNPKKILLCPEIGVLHERIAARIPLMLSGGAMVEAERIIASGVGENRAIGAMQLCKFIRGEINEAECIENWITKTNQYAKRQRTWFRTQYTPNMVINGVPTCSDVDAVL